MQNLGWIGGALSSGGIVLTSLEIAGPVLTTVGITCTTGGIGLLATAGTMGVIKLVNGKTLIIHKDYNHNHHHHDNNHHHDNHHHHDNNDQCKEYIIIL